MLLARTWFSNPIAWDGFGYYLYLPLIFVHHDLGMEDQRVVEGMFAEYGPSETFYQAHQAPTGHWVIRYTPGLALLHAPGFLVAHALAGPFGHPRDGLSKPYQVAVVVTSVLWLWAGLFFLLRLLSRWYRWPVAFAATAIVLYGTNLMDQAVEHPLMTHLYSFSLLAMLLWATVRLHEMQTSGRALFAGLVLGLLVLVRPTNALAVLIPLLWSLGEGGLFMKFRMLVSSHRVQVVVFGLAVALPVLLLLAYWKHYGGSWLYDSYHNPGEGLDLLYPHLHHFLFSFRKGWFVYTPLVLVGVLGLAFGLRGRLLPLRLPLWTFLLVFLYVVSSWTIWYYPGGFGQRAAVDVLSVVAIGLAAAITWALEGMAVRRWFVGTVLVLGVMLLQFQVWQQRQHFRPPDRMTAAYYGATFLALERDPALEHLLAVDRIRPGEGPEPGRYAVHAWWSFPQEGAEVVLDPEHPFTAAFERPFQALTPADHAWVEVRGKVWSEDLEHAQASVVVHMDHEGTYGYRSMDLEQVVGHQAPTWVPFSFFYLTPEARRPWDTLRAYVWHRAGAPVRCRDLEVISHVPRTP